MNGRSFFKLINLTFEWYIKENLRIHHDNNLLKNMVLKFEFELFILDDFRKVSKSKIGVPLRVPFWAGVRLLLCVYLRKLCFDHALYENS